MIIEESDYKLTQISEDSLFWDLELIHTVKPKGKEPRKEFKNSGYGLTLSHAIQKIANYRIHNNHPEEAITMKDYIKELKDNINTLKEIFYEKENLHINS